MTEAAVPTGPTTRSSVARVGVATVVSAACGYAVLYLAARDLDPAGFSVFAVFWGAFGLATGATNGLLQQSTREVRLAELSTSEGGGSNSAGPRSGGTTPPSEPGGSVGAGPRSGGTTPPSEPGGSITHPMRVAAVVGVVSAVLIVLSATLWSARVFAESRWLSVLLLAAGLAGFCLHATLLGMLAGAGRWSQYGVLMVTDAMIRVLVAAATVLIGWGLVGFLWATVAGAIAWLLLLIASPASRAAAQLVAHDDTRGFLRGAAHAVAASGASAILVMGFPVLLKATSGDLGAAGGVVILAVTLTRAPLLMPLNALQGNLIAHFVDQRQHRLRSVLAPLAIVLGAGALGIALAYYAGPWLLRVGFGASYDASAGLLAWLTAGAVAIAVLTVTGAAAVAAALHRAYSAGWIGATLTAAVLLTLPLELESRTVVALLCGPMVGIAVHLGALARS